MENWVVEERVVGTDTWFLSRREGLRGRVFTDRTHALNAMNKYGNQHAGLNQNVRGRRYRLTSLFVD